MPLFKIRITSDNERDAELIRAVFRAAFSERLTLAKARQGRNPKYADDPKWLAYGELEVSYTEIADALNAVASVPPPAAPPAPAPTPKRSRKPKAPGYTQETIRLSPGKPRRKKS